MVKMKLDNITIFVDDSKVVEKKAKGYVVVEDNEDAKADKADGKKAEDAKADKADGKKATPAAK